MPILQVLSPPNRSKIIKGKKQNFVESQYDQSQRQTYILVKDIEGVPLLAILLPIFKEDFERVKSVEVVFSSAEAIHQALLILSILFKILESFVDCKLIK